MIRRPKHLLTSLRDARRSMGDGTITGRARLPTPRKGREPPRTLKRIPTQLSGAEPVGVAAHLLAEDVEVDGSALLPWGSVQRPPGLAGVEEEALDLPSDEFTIGVTGYWSFAVAGEWDTYTGDSTMEVLRNGTKVWPPAVWPGYVQTGAVVEFRSDAIPFEQGDVAQVRIVLL